MSFKIDDILNFKNSANSSASSSASSVSSCSPTAAESVPTSSLLHSTLYQAMYPHLDMFSKSNGIREARPSPDECQTEQRKKLTKARPKKKKEQDDAKCQTCAGNCADIASSISSVLTESQAQLPMCLRGSSEEQLHLATLFNSLMHHKKCRRTRTVFTDMQLIGLEKRFENQKYLSTPDRIQLAESLGLSQLQVKTWYQNRRMKWKKKVLKDGCRHAPTKPKGRPKKNSIPSFSEILAAAAKASGQNACDSQSNMSEESININDYSSESEVSEEIDVEEENDQHSLAIYQQCYQDRATIRSDN